jgi:hypothetical protein
LNSIKPEKPASPLERATRESIAFRIKASLSRDARGEILPIDYVNRMIDSLRFLRAAADEESARYSKRARWVRDIPLDESYENGRKSATLVLPEKLRAERDLIVRSRIRSRL